MSERYEITVWIPGHEADAVSTTAGSEKDALRIARTYTQQPMLLARVQRIVTETEEIPCP